MKEGFNTKKLVQLALMVAMSGVGAYIIIPSLIGTVALDSAPGYLASLIFGGISGGIVLFLGHLISALKMGFPLGLIHLFIAILMGGCGLVFTYLYNKANIFVSSIVVIILNGLVITALLIPFLGYGFFISMMGPLLLGTTVNIIIAAIINKLLREKGVLDGISKQSQLEE